MLNKNKSLIIWISIIIFSVGVANLFKSDERIDVNVISFSDFASDTNKGLISSVVIHGNHVYGQMKNGQKFSTVVPSQDQNLVSRLLTNHVHVEAAGVKDASFITWISIILSWLPSLLIIGMMLYSMRKMQQGGPGKAMGFGQSKAKLVVSDPKNRIMFNSVAGAKEAKEELAEIVDFLKNKDKFSKLGARVPKGVLLSGPPGTGKTMLAKSVAGEAGVPFFATSGSDFIEMFAGVGASRVREMFAQAKKSAPCIIFIDEIDAVGAKRSVGLGGGYEERDQTLNQLLVEMDGFGSDSSVIILASTNRANILDPALLRSGRFDRQVVTNLPNLEERKEIVKLYVDKVKVDENVDIDRLAKGTPGFSGADLSNLVNEAALSAGKHNKSTIDYTDFEEAKDKILMGSRKKSLVLSDADRKLTAYHEAGHALIAFYTKHSDPIHKATIIPRGHALGVVITLPDSDEVSVSKAKLLDQLAVAMGGLAAETIIFGPEYVTTGASSDINKATSIARNMVSKWGMGGVGYVNYVYNDQHYSSTSEETYKSIDVAVKKIVDNAFKTASDMLNKHMDKLHGLAKKLLEMEEMSGSEIKELLESL